MRREPQLFHPARACDTLALVVTPECPPIL
jgi:hypothetical protein